jgi:hypothetical protein
MIIFIKKIFLFFFFFLPNSTLSSDFPINFLFLFHTFSLHSSYFQSHLNLLFFTPLNLPKEF